MIVRNDVFLSEVLTFTDKSLYFTKKDDDIEIVMDICEDSLMKKTAENLIRENDELLEVGFGMGIFSNYAQLMKPKKHTIVEGHPQVFKRLLEWSEDKPNVEVIFGDWFDQIDTIKGRCYDSVYFDTHRDPNVYNFFKCIKDSIRKNGRYSRFGLDLRLKNFVNIEFGDVGFDVLFKEDHNIIPSENVHYIPNNTFPIHIIKI